jgi:mono/diheme cytochrome c family protein
MRSRRQIERNRFNTDLTPKGDIHRVPIDGDIEQGSRIYMQNCSSCHSLESVVNK